ncbi:MAG: sugar phosphate isomerase/epimerase [Kiritimatiellae bacterium]|nr:sugar phosphate isomerase/epimerase [Kiritimatiellia bacterium]
MKFALSTNWCNRKYSSGEEIADKALELGFAALELGFNTTQDQLAGFLKRLDQIPVESVHAFCPVPLSAPDGSPELYSLASPDENERAMARIYLLKTIDTASDMGAKSIVLHAGRIPLATFFSKKRDSHLLRETLIAAKGDTLNPKYRKVLNSALSARNKRAAKITDIFLRELESIEPVLEKRSLALALENLPFLEGYPNEVETLDIVTRLSGSRVFAWFDTGHHRVREMHGWIDDDAKEALEKLEEISLVRGMHINDVKDYYDDHFAPGGGGVDFTALSSMAEKAEHIVFEPKSHVSEENLSKSISSISSIWKI